MKKEVFVVSDNIISPLGFTSQENFAQLKAGISGIKLHNDTSLWQGPFYASLIEDEKYFNGTADNNFTRFEKLLIASIKKSIENISIDLCSSKTIFIISTTKGNIGLLENEQLFNTEQLALHQSAKIVASFFKNSNQPIVVSNACISGVLSTVTGMRLIQSGLYDNAVIVGADLISKFILSGFYSFQAISEEPCKPFDKIRDGITLGEAAGTIILSTNIENNMDAIAVRGGSSSNDANHISGPSRTGEELSHTMEKAMQEAGVTNGDVDFISSHGTATVYNDEMEANAIALAGLNEVPLNSLKGYFGHTLGAAGIIESVISIHSLKNNLIIPTKGFTESGVSKNINICSSLKNSSLKNCLKTASGFGGCNASMLLSKK